MVFISYSTKDHAAAQELRDYLENTGINCWMAPNSIEAGSDYGDSIPQAISDCDAFAILVSDASQSSVWCPKELDWALSCRAVILPLQIDSSALTDAFQFRLINVQRIMAFRNMNSAYKELENRIKSLSMPAGTDQTTIPITNVETDQTTEQAADEDHPSIRGDALFDLGMDYYYGRGVPRDYNRALILVQKTTQTTISELNRKEAEGILPRMYYWVGRQFANKHDISVKDGQPDEGLASFAASYYRKAHELGDSWGTCELGRCYRDGKGVEQDLNEAIRLASFAAKQGDYGGNYDMGMYYKDGNGVKQDFAKAADYFAQAAKDGNRSLRNRSVSKYYEAVTRRNILDLNQALAAAKEAKLYAEKAMAQGEDNDMLKFITPLIDKLELDIMMQG